MKTPCTITGKGVSCLYLVSMTNIASPKGKVHNRTTHGMSRTSEHRAWLRIKSRCYNPNFAGYKNYGGRGITMCDRWLNSFENFYEDMGDKPSEDLSLDRIDNDGNYEPENCRWATSKQQNRNQSQSVFLTINGETKHVAEWCEISGIKHSVCKNRLWKGWSPEDAVFKKPRKRVAKITHKAE